MIDTLFVLSAYDIGVAILLPSISVNMLQVAAASLHVANWEALKMQLPMKGWRPLSIHT